MRLKLSILAASIAALSSAALQAEQCSLPMSADEQREHHQKMAEMSPEERRAYRDDMYSKLRQRANTCGWALPADAPWKDGDMPKMSAEEHDAEMRARMEAAHGEMEERRAQMQADAEARRAQMEEHAAQMRAQADERRAQMEAREAVTAEVENVEAVAESADATVAEAVDAREAEYAARRAAFEERRRAADAEMQQRREESRRAFQERMDAAIGNMPAAPVIPGTPSFREDRGMPEMAAPMAPPAMRDMPRREAPMRAERPPMPEMRAPMAPPPMRDMQRPPMPPMAAPGYRQPPQQWRPAPMEPPAYPYAPPPRW